MQIANLIAQYFSRSGELGSPLWAAKVMSVVNIQEKKSNIIYLPFMTPEVRACAKACGMGVEAYIKQVIQFANDAVKNEQVRNIILNR